MEAILTCHPALTTEWLDWVAFSCEIWYLCTGPIISMFTKFNNYYCCHSGASTCVYNVRHTAWGSEIGSLTSLDAPELHASSDIRELISLQQAVVYTNMPPSPVTLWIELVASQNGFHLNFWIPWCNAHEPQIFRVGQAICTETHFQTLLKFATND